MFTKVMKKTLLITFLAFIPFSTLNAENKFSHSCLPATDIDKTDYATLEKLYKEQSNTSILIESIKGKKTIESCSFLFYYGENYALDWFFRLDPIVQIAFMRALRGKEIVVLQ